MEKNLEDFKIDEVFIDETKDQLIKVGEQKQQKVTTKQLSTYNSVQRDVVSLIKATEDKMIPELIPLRHQRMMQNPFTFFRGTAGLMELDLKKQNQSHIPTIICGDAHLNNFGFYASPERQLLFGLNDFDEARVGNWESDLKRLLVSIILTGEVNGYTASDITDTLKSTIRMYRHGIKHANGISLIQRFYLSYTILDLMAFAKNDTQMTHVLDKIIKRAPNNNSDKVVKKFTTTDASGNLIFKENPPRARRVSPELYEEIKKAFRQYQADSRDSVKVFLINFKVCDIIRYSVGVGSFGTRCYLVLLEGKDGSHLVLQIKEALPLRFNMSSLTVRQSNEQSFDEGDRIITAQRVLQTYSDVFLGSMQFGSRSYYVRQFRDMKDSIDASKLDKESFEVYSQMCSFMLSMAHYRTPTAPMIYGYLKGQKDIDTGFSDWSWNYSKQVHKDYDTFQNYLINGK